MAIANNHPSFFTQHHIGSDLNREDSKSLGFTPNMRCILTQYSVNLLVNRYQPASLEMCSKDLEIKLQNNWCTDLKLACENQCTR
jgi:hypothetical protein